MAMVAAGFTGGEAEELRRAFGFKRSEKRMQQIEGKLRAGMARQGHHRRRGGGDHPLDHVVRALRISRVARRELRAARLCQRLPQGALSGGVLHGAAQQPADGVLSSGDAGEGRAAPRRPLRADRRAGVGLGLPRRTGRPRPARADVRQRPAAGDRPGDRRRGAAPRPARRSRAARGRDPRSQPMRCPKCGCDDPSMLEATLPEGGFCNICAHEWGPAQPAPRRRSADRPRAIDRSTRSSRTGVRRDELRRSEIGALDGAAPAVRRDERRRRWPTIGALECVRDLDRRSASWQVERPRAAGRRRSSAAVSSASGARPRRPERIPSIPLRPMTAAGTAAGRLCRDEPDHRPAPDGAAARRAGAARGAARQRSAARRATAGGCASPAR